MGTYAVALVSVFAGLMPAGPAQSLESLRCESRVNPLSVDVPVPRLSWVLHSAQRGQVQTAYHIVAATSPERLAEGKADLWDSGKVVSNRSVHVPYAGKPLRSGLRVYWRVRAWGRDDTASAWSEPAFFQVGILSPKDWTAKWISQRPSPEARRASPYLRKSFTLPAAPRRGTAYVSALGLYELRLNGRRVGDQVLAPEWTDYRQRVQYQTYDVTELLKLGENVVGAILGDGWYAGEIGVSFIVPDGPTRGIYGERPAFFLQLEVALSDGSKRTMASDGTWRVTSDGPIRGSSLLQGEVQDRRYELGRWDAAGYDDSGWHPVVVGTCTARLVSQPNEPIRIVAERQARGLSEPAPGVYVFDFGQNLVGWCRLRTRGPAGTEVTLRHAEVLLPDGNVYTANLRKAAQLDRFILGGEGDEECEPRFTYHGFRYVEARGLATRPTLDALRACVVHSSSPVTGRFACSSPLLTKLMQNIAWTQRGNMHSVPTDCPQRDERMGWLGDAQVFSQTACFNRDMALFFTKWLRDIRDAQTDDGRFPDFAPHPYEPEKRFSGAPAWGDGGVIIPWRAYVNYGDRRFLEENFEAARRWVEHVRTQSPDLRWTGDRGNDYNDWLNGNTLKLEGWPRSGAAVPKEVFATAFFAHSSELVSKMAARLGRPQDAQRYGSLAREIKASFQRAFVKEDGTILGDTQAGYALALHFDLLAAELRGHAVRHAVARVRDYGGHLSTGIHSTGRLLLELSRAGRDDLAYSLVLERSVPSWGYMIDQGATTIWERWDGDVEGRGLQNPEMNSFNHYALGAVGEWVYRVVLGINPDEAKPGYEHFTLRPRPGGGLRWARGSFDSVRGRIASRWEVDARGLKLEVSVPVNSTATLHIPAARHSRISEGGRDAADADGVRFLRRDVKTAVYEIGSGDYRFRVRHPAAVRKF